jgi:hypothetical protein
MIDIRRSGYETHLLVHWWTVDVTTRGRRDSVPLSGTCAGGHRLLFRFEGVVPSHPSVELRGSLEMYAAPLFGGSLRTAEQARASFRSDLRVASMNEITCSFQANKSQRWMPWRQEPMKDVSDCEKLRGAVY